MNSFHENMCIKYGEWPNFIYKPKDRKTNRLVQSLGVNDVEFSKEPTIGGKRIAHPLYESWKKMLERCSDTYYLKYPTYKGVYVCEEFKSLSKYMQWAKDKYIKGYVLDKDIIVRGNKEYSPSTCVFVPQEVNKFLTSRINDRGPTLLGTHLTQSGKFVVTIGKELKCLGTYSSEVDAHKAWQSEKIIRAKLLMEEHNIPELINVITRLENDYNTSTPTEIV